MSVRTSKFPWEHPLWSGYFPFLISIYHISPKHSTENQKNTYSPLNIIGGGSEWIILIKEVIESLSEPAKRVFKSLDYRSKQRMLKKAREMAKAEKMKRRKKRRFKKKGIEKLNKGKKQKKGSSSKSERVLFSIHETRELMVQSMHLMLLGSSVADASYEERNTEYSRKKKYKT